MDSEIVIHVENLSKEYVLGGGGLGAGGLRHAIQDAVTFRWLRGNSRPAADSFWALRDVSFDIRRGEVVGIIGRNGAGKSTLLKVLSRITEPTKGRIGIKGRIASLLEVGTGFHPELSGRENIYLNGAILGMTRTEIRAKFDEIVQFAEIERFLDTPVKRYSSGMYVRLAFAVAAHLEPEILVVDEVLAVGDAQFQQKCLGKMQEVSSRHGRTVLFVSHAMHSVQALCSTGILLDQGRIEKRGPVGDVVAAYSGRSTASAAAGALASNRATGVTLLRADVHLDNDLGALAVKASFQLDLPVHNAGLGVHVQTPDGFELCDLRPETTGLRFGDRSGPLEIEFTIPEICRRLGAGSYLLGLSFHETNWKRCLERTPVGDFIIPATDLFATGYPPKLEKDGPVVLPVCLRHAVP